MNTVVQVRVIRYKGKGIFDGCKMILIENFHTCLMAPHSSTLAWKIPWTAELVGCSPWGR